MANSVDSDQMTEGHKTTKFMMDAEIVVNVIIFKLCKWEDYGLRIIYLSAELKTNIMHLSYKVIKTLMFAG